VNKLEARSIKVAQSWRGGAGKGYGSELLKPNQARFGLSSPQVKGKAGRGQTALSEGGGLLRGLALSKVSTMLLPAEYVGSPIDSIHGQVKGPWSLPPKNGIPSAFLGGSQGCVSGTRDPGSRTEIMRIGGAHPSLSRPQTSGSIISSSPNREGGGLLGSTISSSPNREGLLSRGGESTRRSQSVTGGDMFSARSVGPGGSSVRSSARGELPKAPGYWSATGRWVKVTVDKGEHSILEDPVEDRHLQRSPSDHGLMKEHMMKELNKEMKPTAKADVEFKEKRRWELGVTKPRWQEPTTKHWVPHRNDKGQKGDLDFGVLNVQPTAYMSSSNYNAHVDGSVMPALGYEPTPKQEKELGDAYRRRTTEMTQYLENALFNTCNIKAPGHEDCFGTSMNMDERGPFPSPKQRAMVSPLKSLTSMV